MPTPSVATPFELGRVTLVITDKNGVRQVPSAAAGKPQVPAVPAKE